MDETGAPKDDWPIFDADAAIGRGWRTLARRGQVTVCDGKLRMAKYSGEAILEAPLSEIRAEPMRMALGASARIFRGTDKYWVRPLKLNRYDTDRAAVPAVSFVGDVVEVLQDIGMTQRFLAAIRAEGGQTSE